MSSLQRVIKYCAIAFAIILCVGIISSIAGAGAMVVSFISGDRIDSNDKDLKDFSDTFVGVQSLDIDNSTGTLYIKVGDTFKVEAEDVTSDFEAKVDSNGKLVISEKQSETQFFFFNFNLGGIDSANSKITVYLPEDFIAEEAKIDTGAGTVNIEGLNAEDLIISAGAGNISGVNMTSQEVKIDGGVGSVDFENIIFEDTDLDCGVGNIKLQGILTGDNKIDCGVGEVELNLIGNEADYELDIDSGVGKIRVNGSQVSDEDMINSGAPNSIRVDGGVGNVNIDIAE
ncbi:MAG: DUF4097 family beta strand repeat-containing protein [Mobilitalea sp.]